MKPVKQYKALHSDDITAIGFIPGTSSQFYTCSMDGIINIVDINAVKQSESALQCKKIK